MNVLELVLDHYDISYRSGRGETPIKCPVHDDSNASASANFDKGVFNCHACGASGSAYDVVMIREGVDFAASKPIVERITGIGYSSGGGASKPSAPVPVGEGYRPRVRRKVQTRGRQRPEY